MKILNLYAGIGGNRKLWGEEHEIIAVENNPEIARIYKDFFPNDNVIVADAHEYLLEHYKEFDFIWSSPPCPTHGVSRYWATKTNNNPRANYPPKYPDIKLYEEIIFLKYFFKGKWVVENVVSYYEPLIKPFHYKSHYYWSNFVIDGKKRIYRGISSENIAFHQKVTGFDISKYKGVNKTKILRNCVEPEAGLFVFNCAFKTKQNTLQTFK